MLFKGHKPGISAEYPEFCKPDDGGDSNSGAGL
jgi:hypothetical protein